MTTHTKKTVPPQTHIDRDRLRGIHSKVVSIPIQKCRNGFSRSFRGYAKNKSVQALQKLPCAVNRSCRLTVSNQKNVSLITGEMKSAVFWFFLVGNNLFLLYNFPLELFRNSSLYLVRLVLLYWV